MSPTFETVIYKIIGSGIRPVMLLLFSWATVVFLYAVFQYLTKPKDMKSGEITKTISWGVVILAAMFSIWGLVNLVVDFFDLPNSETIDIPQV